MFSSQLSVIFSRIIDFVSTGSIDNYAKDSDEDRFTKIHRVL